MAKGKKPAADKPVFESKKPGQGRKKFSKGFVQNGSKIQFFMWGTKKIVLKGL